MVANDWIVGDLCEVVISATIPVDGVNVVNPTYKGLQVPLPNYGAYKEVYYIDENTNTLHKELIRNGAEITYKNGRILALPLSEYGRHCLVRTEDGKADIYLLKQLRKPGQAPSKPRPAGIRYLGY